MVDAGRHLVQRQQAAHGIMAMTPMMRKQGDGDRAARARLA